MKILKAVELGGLSLILTGVIILFEYNNWPAGSSLSGIALGFSLPAFWKSLQDITDTTNWKTSQRKLKRGDFMENEKEQFFSLENSADSDETSSGENNIAYTRKLSLDIIQRIF